MSQGRSGRGKRILVVDDEDIVRELVVEFLESLEYEVDAARNGQEALQRLEAGGAPFDAVLLDAMMPVLGGIEALKAMRARNLTMPVILASAFSKEEGIREALETPGVGFIQKPYHLSELVKALGALLPSAD